MSSDPLTLTAPPSACGGRLDAWLSSLPIDRSRSAWQKLIDNGHILVDGQVHKPKYTLRGNETIHVTIPKPVEIQLTPENIPLDILYEDADLIVLNKQPGLVVHPAPGHDTGTLVHALLYHCHDLTGVNGSLRPGIVHRLDKDTSGAMVVAKNDLASQSLTEQFKERLVHKEYLALVRGHFDPSSGTIQTQIGRSSRDRKKMSVHTRHGRSAISHYTTEEVFDKMSLVRIRLETGRTHQIRVHMAHKGHPIAGDPTYGHALRNIGPYLLTRQMLHARHIEFTHPRTSKTIKCTAPLPPDMESVLLYLQNDK